MAGKLYHRCRACELVWLDAAEHLEPAREKAVYDGHDNQVDDPRYRQFLQRAFGEVLSRLPPPASGLDFGCGPGPALIAMGREAGYQMAGYDKFYADEPELLAQQYDFITSTEVIEHIATPRAVLDGLWGCLKPGGLLVLQTQRCWGRALPAVALSPRSDPYRLLRRGLVSCPGGPLAGAGRVSPRGCGGHHQTLNGAFSFGGGLGMLMA